MVHNNHPNASEILVNENDEYCIRQLSIRLAHVNIGDYFKEDSYGSASSSSIPSLLLSRSRAFNDSGISNLTDKSTQGENPGAVKLDTSSTTAPSVMATSSFIQYSVNLMVESHRGSRGDYFSLLSSPSRFSSPFHDSEYDDENRRFFFFNKRKQNIGRFNKGKATAAATSNRKNGTGKQANAARRNIVENNRDTNGMGRKKCVQRVKNGRNNQQLLLGEDTAVQTPKTNRQFITVYRRYSQFRALYEALREREISMAGKGTALTTSLMPPFPPKRFWLNFPSLFEQKQPTTSASAISNGKRITVNNNTASAPLNAEYKEPNSSSSHNNNNSNANTSSSFHRRPFSSSIAQLSARALDVSLYRPGSCFDLIIWPPSLALEQRIQGLMSFLNYLCSNEALLSLPLVQSFLGLDSLIQAFHDRHHNSSGSGSGEERKSVMLNPAFASTSPPDTCWWEQIKVKIYPIPQLCPSGPEEEEEEDEDDEQATTTDHRCYDNTIEDEGIVVIVNDEDEDVDDDDEQVDDDEVEDDHLLSVSNNNSINQFTSRYTSLSSLLLNAEDDEFTSTLNNNNYNINNNASSSVAAYYYSSNCTNNNNNHLAVNSNSNSNSCVQLHKSTM